MNHPNFTVYLLIGSWMLFNNQKKKKNDVKTCLQIVVFLYYYALIIHFYDQYAIQILSLDSSKACYIITLQYIYLYKYDTNILCNTSYVNSI
jgi:hypothetical protein